MINKGFSLIELLIVIAILAIISSVGMMGFTAAQKRTRDTNRKSDLQQYRSSLEAYANRNNGLYPNATIDANSLCGASYLNLGITCPTDPKSGTYEYIGDGLKYVLYGVLENPSPSANTYFGLCSTGTSLSQAGVPTLGNCP